MYRRQSTTKNNLVPLTSCFREYQSDDFNQYVNYPMVIPNDPFAFAVTNNTTTAINTVNNTNNTNNSSIGNINTSNSNTIDKDALVKQKSFYTSFKTLQKQNSSMLSNIPPGSGDNAEEAGEFTPSSYPMSFNDNSNSGVVFDDISILKTNKMDINIPPENKNQEEMLQSVGLNDWEVDSKRDVYGKNDFYNIYRVVGWVAIVRDIIRQHMYVSMMAVLLLFILHQFVLSFVYIIIIITLICVRYYNEKWVIYDKVISIINSHIPYSCTVKRNYAWVKLDSSKLVPGDVIVLEGPGSIVPADCRINYVNNPQTTGKFVYIFGDVICNRYVL